MKRMRKPQILPRQSQLRFERAVRQSVEVGGAMQQSHISPAHFVIPE